ncbi:MAG TPA: MarR family winged helix-turn-helix transcriptional regulator [Devosiaceae bacterium]|nr:MarR family winged helix-turn-helix transcriptional regulator [Devosiaceae bacterium]
MSAPNTAVADVAAWEAYQRMRVLLSAQIGRELAKCSNLSEAEFDILSVLADAKDGTLRALSLRCGLDWEKSRLSHQIGRMEKRGLLRRQAYAGDGRSTLICLTDFGRETFAEGKATHERVVSEYFTKVLTAADLAALTRMAGKIVARLEQVDARPHHANDLHPVDDLEDEPA